MAAAQVSSLLSRPPGEWPEYVRGKGQYPWILSKYALKNGQSFLGTNERLRVKLTDLNTAGKQGATTKVVFLGGSITLGAGWNGAPSWPQYVTQYLEDEFGAERIQSVNAAVGSTGSAYMSVCHSSHVPQDGDIYFVEYACNDAYAGVPAVHNEARAAYEKMLRTLLKFPKHPAVVVMHAFYPRFQVDVHPPPSHYWITAEREQFEFSTYYHLPTLSIRSCCYHLMATHTPGFDTRIEARDVNLTTNPELKNVPFAYDQIHPNGHTGHRVMAELAMYLVQQTLQNLRMEPLADEERQMAAAELPHPMLPDNYESDHDLCFVGQAFQKRLIAADGFVWKDEGRSKGRPKVGMLATAPGSWIDIEVDTRLTQQAVEEADSAGSSRHIQSTATNGSALIMLSHLKSYAHMGVARVECIKGCSCQPTTFDGHHQLRESQQYLHKLTATQAASCIIRVTVQDRTRSGEHKVKLGGIIVSQYHASNSKAASDFDAGAVRAGRRRST